MSRIVALSVALSLASGCAGGEGEWVLTTWGEAYIEEGIGASAFADGCSASFDRFVVGFSAVSLLDAEGQAMAALDGPRVVDLVPAGPHELARLGAPVDLYPTVRSEVKPTAGAEGDPALPDGASLDVAGEVTCGGVSVRYALVFDTATTYDCEPKDLSVPRGGEVATELTIHGDHLFYDGLENEDAEVRGQAWVDADADGDGQLTEAELAAVPVATLGYQVGRYAEVTDLLAFVRAQTHSVGHIDGEGHCATSF